MRKVTQSIAEHYSWGDECDGWHFLKREDASIIKEKMPPGTYEQLHLHEKSRQFFYVLTGTATFKVKNELIVVNHHEGIEIEPNEPHQIRNEGSDFLEFILFSYPTTRGDRVKLIK